MKPILAKAVTKDMGGSMRTSDIGDWIAMDILKR